MPWKRLLAYITGTVDQDLLLRNEYLVAENRILRGQILGRLRSPIKVRRRSWARLIARVWCENPALCPTCGKEMKILPAITSPGQDDVIEKILRARGEWAPPWLSARPARGPPQRDGTNPGTEADWIDPPPTDQQYFEDPSGED